MTRETRIGLLVGLAFIVMFGLILSELMSSKIPTATIAAVDGGNSDGEPNAPPGPGGSEVGHGPPGRRVSGIAPALFRRSEGPSGGGPLLAANGASRRRDQGPSATDTSAGRRVPSGHVSSDRRTYRVQSGDTLIKIARKVYGASHGDQYRRIFEANRAVLRDEATLRIGQELVIPPLGRGVSPEAPPDAGRPEPRAAGDYREMGLSELARHFSADGSGGVRTHVVRKGDTLSDIARRYMGDSGPAAVAKIFNANKDRLNSADVLPLGVELRIPRR